MKFKVKKNWNDVILAFRNGMPVGRHRRYMKTYIDCFSTSEATDWLHEYLKNNANFGPDVTRARVIEDVRGSKHNRADIQDNGRLFRFTLLSPVKSRTPFKDRRDLINQEQQFQIDGQIGKVPSMPCLNVEKLPSCHILVKDLTLVDIEEIWKNMTLDRLQIVLDIEEMDDILDSNCVNGKYIKHNCTFINKNGVVTNIDPKDQLPHWALSAMKCLAHCKY
ncbi:hypothetical protein KUTeg_016504 [Tegillarca granosa]|uniref:DEP domain-containing protein n=1 Tax=Tegillarca granosa TaxID=220873 RepID=A0ABQ9EL17_TEGGR|nr:hypothetical protein KUTeg_016504 [Tegillarca granosa]